ncbi:restriction endonuclease subunit S [Streptomyces sp. NPDC002533]
MSTSLVAPWLSDSRWPTAPIRFVARLGSGHTPSRNVPEYWEDCKVPWITLADVWQLRTGRVDVITDTKEKISSLGLANSSAVRHPAGTVILSRTASVGFSAIMGTAMATSQDFATWTCGPDLDPRFLLHSLRAMAPDLKRVATGSTHKTIYMPDIEQLRVPLPSIDKQRRIAEFLDAETGRISLLLEARNRQLDALAELWNSRLATAVDDLISNHGLVPLRRVVRSVEQGWSPQCEDAHAEPNEWAVLKTSAVSSGVFRPSEHKKLPADLQPDLRYRILDGDLLMTRGSGSVEHVGMPTVAHTEGRSLLLSDLLYRVRTDRGWNPEFVALMLRSRPVRGFMSLLLRGQSGQTIKLRSEDIKAIDVPAVPVESQARIVTKLSNAEQEIEAVRAAIERSATRLAERRQGLITAAVTGQLDVTTAGRAAAV